MASPDDAVQGWLNGLSFKLKREVVRKIKEEAERLRSAIEDAAPKGETLNLSKSVKVRRRRNDLDLEVTAGGDLTTKNYDRSVGYEREVVVDGRDNRGIAKQKGGKGVTYDYSLAQEYGTQDGPAQPFFFNTAREMMPEIRQNIEDAVNEAISKA